MHRHPSNNPPVHSTSPTLCPASLVAPCTCVPRAFPAPDCGSRLQRLQSLRPELHTLAVGGPSWLPSHRLSRHERQQLQAHGEVDQPSELALWIFRSALTASGQGIRTHRDVQRMKMHPDKVQTWDRKLPLHSAGPEPPNPRMHVDSAFATRRPNLKLH